jgi:hypothetical protein
MRFQKPADLQAKRRGPLVSFLGSTGRTGTFFRRDQTPRTGDATARAFVADRRGYSAAVREPGGTPVTARSRTPLAAAVCNLAPRTVLKTGSISHGIRADADYLHALLRHFEQRGFEGAPRYLGLDGRGRAIFAHIDGSRRRTTASR